MLTYHVNTCSLVNHATIAKFLATIFKLVLLEKKNRAPGHTYCEFFINDPTVEFYFSAAFLIGKTLFRDV